MVKRGELVVYLSTCEWRHLECNHCRTAFPTQELEHHTFMHVRKHLCCAHSGVMIAIFQGMGKIKLSLLYCLLMHLGVLDGIIAHSLKLITDFSLFLISMRTH